MLGSRLALIQGLLKLSLGSHKSTCSIQCCPPVRLAVEYVLTRALQQPASRRSRARPKHSTPTPLSLFLRIAGTLHGGFIHSLYTLYFNICVYIYIYIYIYIEDLMILRLDWGPLLSANPICSKFSSQVFSDALRQLPQSML